MSVTNILKQVIIYSTGLAVVSAALLGSLDYAHIVDIQPVLDFVSLKSSELATMGFSGSAILLGGLRIIGIVQNIQDQSKEDTRLVLSGVLDELEKVALQNERILAYDTLMATKNVEGRVLTDDQKVALLKWIESVEPDTYEQLSNIVPKELLMSTLDVIAEATPNTLDDTIIDILKKV